MTCPLCTQGLEQEKLDVTGRMWWCNPCARYFIERNGIPVPATKVA